MENGVSVIMPVYNQQRFIRGAILSLLKQSFANWELIIANDGSNDGLEETITDLIAHDDRITYIDIGENKGLGYCINLAIKHSKFSFIAYLPADDIYFSDHLNSLYETLSSSPSIVLSYSGIKYNYRDTGYMSGSDKCYYKVNNLYFQLVQVMHRKVNHLWKERTELVTDDLDLMFFHELKKFGEIKPTKRVTAEWVSHSDQRHKHINELYGGNIFNYKKYYSVTQKLKFQSSNGIRIDEYADYEVNDVVNKIVNSDKPLKILIVGELAYNPDRVRAFEDKGHKLYGLWIDHPYYYNTIGPLPFGNIEDISKDNWQAKIKEIKPDIIYSLLNILSVPLAYEVLMNVQDVPFVWHFKEGPFFSRQRGDWNKLIDIYTKSNGLIYINHYTKNWFEQFFVSEKNSLLLDGDLPYGAYFRDKRSQLLSDIDGEVHTVTPGRPFGISPNDVRLMAREKIHLHFYGNQENMNKNWINNIGKDALAFLHFHPVCHPSNWTEELSKYDAGWLHIFNSSNFGEISRFEWPDINYPARMSTLAAAGLPMIQKNNAMHAVATQDLAKELEIGIFFSTYNELSDKLNDRDYLKSLRENCWRHRKLFSFDHHIDDLLDFFRKVIAEFDISNRIEK